MPKTPYNSSPGDQNRTSDDKEIHTVTATTATAGSNGAVPAQVAGYVVVSIGGVDKKIPYFNV